MPTELLKELGYKENDINAILNTYLLTTFEIENYIEERLKNNELLEDIVDDLESNPYLFNEF